MTSNRTLYARNKYLESKPSSQVTKQLSEKSIEQKLLVVQSPVNQVTKQLVNDQALHQAVHRRRHRDRGVETRQPRDEVAMRKLVQAQGAFARRILACGTGSRCLYGWSDGWLVNGWLSV